MVFLDGYSTTPNSELPIPMSCGIHIAGERCSAPWLLNGDSCPVCEAQKAAEAKLEEDNATSSPSKKASKKKASGKGTLLPLEDIPQTLILSVNNGQQKRSNSFARVAEDPQAISMG